MCRVPKITISIYVNQFGISEPIDEALDYLDEQ
jgi:hypothetical protein